MFGKSTVKKLDLVSMQTNMNAIEKTCRRNEGLLQDMRELRGYSIGYGFYPEYKEPGERMNDIVAKVDLILDHLGLTAEMSEVVESKLTLYEKEEE